jgi:chromosomal replication initiation ATPase DnaA
MNDFTFDNFVKLDSNQIALEVIEDFFNSMKYGCVYNPIVIIRIGRKWEITSDTSNQKTY